MFPYTYYSCPCTNVTSSSGAYDNENKAEQAEGDDDDQTFDPHNPRANFALYPIENLLFCNECHEIRCPRCYFEEVLYYYCPQCLLETPSSTVKTETNRCTRSCFQCPICVSPLQLQGFPSSEEQRSKSDQPSMRDGPFILSCPYCAWSTLEIGIKFEKNINISSQLAKIKNGGEPILAPERSERPSSLNPDASIEPLPKPQPSDQFSGLVSFYKNELAESSGASGPGSGFGFDTPSHLSRLLSTYGVGGLKRQRGKPQPMREAATDAEGLFADPPDPDDAADDDALVSRMATLGWAGSTTTEQRALQPDAAPRFHSDVRPIPMPLRSKRAKRCRACRHNLIRPDDKRQSTRYKIRLLALNFVPTAVPKPLDGGAAAALLRPHRAAQFLLTLRNPLFDPVKIHLATPAVTPGRVASRVTILCPQFDIGASADVWDEALDSAARERRRTKDLTAQEGQVAEAGKVWEKGRNWTSVILEVVPADPRAGAERAPGDDVLEVPVLVRMEYYTDASGSDLGSDPESPTYKSTREERVPRELQYWVVLGLGRIEDAQGSGEA